MFTQLSVRYLSHACLVAFATLFLLLVSLPPVQADPCDGPCNPVLNATQVALAAYSAGFRGSALVNAVAVAAAESRFAVNAIRHNSTTSIDYGLWQINVSQHPEYKGHEQQLLYDPNYNARAAYAVSEAGTKWCLWVSFYTDDLNKSFRRYLDNARAAAQFFDPTVIHPLNQEVGQVRATTSVPVMSGAGTGSILRSVQPGTFGVIKLGPVPAPMGTCPNTSGHHYYTWWNVHWSDGGPDGWSMDDGLIRYQGPPPAPTCTLSAKPTTVTPGQSAVLSWASLNATSGTIDNGIGPASPVGSGSRAVSPSRTTTYTAAFSGMGGTARCSETITVITPPPPPSATAATNVTRNSFTANWHSSSGATGYRVDVSTLSSFANFSTVDVGNALSRTFTGLSASTHYYYRVRAYNAAGASGNSNIVTVTTTR